MQRLLAFVVIILTACGGKTGNNKVDYAGPINIQLVNQTSRPIESIFIYPMGATNPGTSWASLAPGASTTVKIKEGKFELLARSARRRVDAHSTEVPEATSQLELREDLASTPRKLIFYDESEAPAGALSQGVLAVTFMLGKPEPVQEEKVEPAPQAP